MSFNATQLIGFLIIYQCLLFVIYLLSNRKLKPFFIKMLLFICVVIAVHFSYMIFGSSLRGNSLFFGPFFGLLYGPLYLHFANSLMFKKVSKNKALLQYIPAVVVLVGLVFFKKNITAGIDYFSIGVTGHFAGYLIAVLVMLFWYRKKLKTTRSTYFNINLKWLEIIIYIQLLAIIVAFTEGFIQSTFQSNILIIIVYLLVLVLLHCFYYLGLKHVGLFEGLEAQSLVDKPTGGYTLDSKTYENYLNSLENYVKQKKPYLNFEVSIADFSKALNISSRNISHIINKEFGTNFYEFVNSYRLEIAKHQLLKTNKQVKEVMYDSGFSNKATFNTFFKKSMGCTPTEFRKKHKN